MKTLVFVFLAAIVLSNRAAALIVSQEVTIEGDVKSYDATHVTLVDHGRTYKVLRSTLPAGTVLKTNQHMKFKVPLESVAPVNTPAPSLKP